MVSQIGEAWLIKDRGFQDTQMVSNDAEVGLHCRGAQIVLDFGAWFQPRQQQVQGIGSWYGLVHIYIYIYTYYYIINYGYNFSWKFPLPLCQYMSICCMWIKWRTSESLAWMIEAGKTFGLPTKLNPMNGWFPCSLPLMRLPSGRWFSH